MGGVYSARFKSSSEKFNSVSDRDYKGEQVLKGATRIARTISRAK